jgi:hypothetical protein
VLLAFGMEADLALAAVLAYRALAGLRQTFARWAEEDAEVTPVPAAAQVGTPLHLPVWPRQEPAVEVAA